ncbi:hypothetical protein MSG28_010254 [Choristoneura fumiferana]|uniref:Uncharacterized protein n=2 Tax=Choristoneura fumiferana TaxID=7141 RepID=A0ACC0KKG6_CHOFU|nr:hypothetical protein MSG28_010254 [Choristoneura fumiferana]
MSSPKLLVPEPVIQDRQFTKPLMCGPGPCDLLPSVIEALTKPVISPLCDEYHEVMADIRAGIQYIFQTRSPLVLPISGSGHSGMETIISNLIAPGEILLIPARGIWDDRAYNMATRYGIRTEVIKKAAPWATFTLEDIEPALKEFRPAGLFITHGDSSTGSLQSLKGLGDLCHK